VDGQHDATGVSCSGDAPLQRRAVRPNIIAIGGSAGALDTILAVAAAFDVDFTGSLFVVSHVGANRSRLPELLSSAGPLIAKHPTNREAIRPATVYVAPPDRHMMVENGHIRLSRGPREHFTRPAVDPLFRSAAREYGARVIGVVLSGTGSDGAAGLDAIKRAGGLTVVQEPATTFYPEMPTAAAALVRVDHVVTGEELPPLLRRLAMRMVQVPAPTTTAETSAEMDERERPIALTCPECGGAMREDNSNGVQQYRCHLGHRFSPEEVATGQLEAIDHAVGVAARVLNERIGLCRHMAENARAAGRTLGVEHWQRLEKEAEDELVVLQRFFSRQPIMPTPEIA